MYVWMYVCMYVCMYKDLGEAAAVPGEKMFWARLHTRIVDVWRKADDLWTQFRLCGFSKIGNIVCNSQDKRRLPPMVSPIPVEMIGTDVVHDEQDKGDECENITARTRMTHPPAR
jgi:hypothetical protein